MPVHDVNLCTIKLDIDSAHPNASDWFKVLCLEAWHSCLLERVNIRLHERHEMKTIVTDDLGICLSCGQAVQKWLNGSTSCLG